MEKDTPTPRSLARRTISKLLNWKLLFTVGLVGLVGSTAAVLYFSQTVPAVSLASPFNGNCSALTYQPSMSATGFNHFNCSTTSALLPSTSITARPIFSLNGTGYSGLYLTSASGCVTLTHLTSGSPLLLNATSYDYCAAYSSYPASGFGTFNVTWNS